jgi:glycosyltransferase involved in cell wall biosynthesis
MITPRSPLGQGGSERHVMEVSRRLAEAGVEIEVLCAGSPGPGVVAERRNGVLIRSVRSWPANRDYYFAPRIWREMALERWDIVHIQSYHTLVPPLAMLRALTLGVPYVVTFHSGGHSSKLRHGLRRVQRRLLRPVLARAARLIAVARFEIDLYARELRLSSERFVLIPNGIDSELESSGETQRPGDGDGSDAEGPLLASIGRLERYKNHQRVIAALPHVLKRQPDARLMIVGTGPYEGALRRLAADLGVADRVELTSLPAEDREGMGRLLRRTSIVVLLSDFETHPLVALEAVAAGRRLLVADRAGLGELARDGLARSVSPRDPPEVVGRAIVDELERPAPQQQTLNLPSWDECAEELLTLYRNMKDAAHSDRTDVQKSPRA